MALEHTSGPAVGTGDSHPEEAAPALTGEISRVRRVLVALILIGAIGACSTEPGDSSAVPPESGDFSATCLPVGNALHGSIEDGLRGQLTLGDAAAVEAPGSRGPLGDR